jgi:hypothetical protein
MSDYREIWKDLDSMAEAYANEVQESAKVMNQDIRIINVEKESICWFCSVSP